MELTDLSAIIRILASNKPDIISHLAAQSWVPYSFQNPIYTIEANTIGTLNLLEAIRIIREFIDEAYNPTIHICSSSEYYGKVDTFDLPITEELPANPGNPYGVGKVGADLLSQLYNKYYDMNIIITRMFTHCGVRRTMMSAENHYAKSIAELEKNGGDTIYISNEVGMNSIRTWADVRDAVKAYYKLFYEGKTGKVYNIAGDTVKSINQVLAHLVSISKLDPHKIKTVENPEFFRKVDVDKQVVNISKFTDDIDWTPDYTFEQLMQDLLDYWRKNV